MTDEESYPVGFTSKTTFRIDAVASKFGWTKHQNYLGYRVEYRRKTLYVAMGVSVRGAVIEGSTNRRGGRNAPSKNTAAWIIEQLSS